MERDKRGCACDCRCQSSLLDEFCAARANIDLDRELDKLARSGASLITQDDALYPSMLRQLPNRPILLYARGALLDADELRLGIVGTRKASKYGWDAAHGLAKDLARQRHRDCVGIGGRASMRRRIAAHWTGADAPIAVVGNGIDIMYPASNQDLAQDIVASGAIVSELPMGSPPLGTNFPQRNRLISGMSHGVLVAEAPERSGALNTVEHACAQGRDVFAVPHNIFSLGGRGCNLLIQEGAKLIRDASDILDELNVTHFAVQTAMQVERIQPANETESVILAQLGADPTHVDDIVRRTKLPTARVTSTLTLLELKGLAESAGAMQYCLARNASQ